MLFFPRSRETIREGSLTRDPELIGGLDNHVYVSVVAAEEMALLGWISPAASCELEDHIENLERENARLEGEVDDLNQDFQAIDMLASKGFVARKKPGRKPAREVEHG